MKATRFNVIQSIVLLCVMIIVGVLPFGFDNYGKILLYFSLLFLTPLFGDFTIDKKLLKSSLLLLIFLLSCLLSKYDSFLKIKYFIDLALVWSISKSNSTVKKSHYLYLIVFIILIVFQMFIGKTDQVGRVAISSLMDPNRSALFTFVIFFLCWRNKIYPLALFCLLLNFAFCSRMFWGMLAIFLFFECMKKTRFAVLVTRLLRLRCMIFVIWSVLFIVMMFFSFMLFSRWSSKSISVRGRGGVLEYNDASNHIRINSNIFGLIRASELDVFIWGLGSELIDSNRKEDKELINTGPIVQPHNTVLNLILSVGVLFACIYLFILSDLLRMYISNETIGFFFSISFSMMILHELLFSYLLYIIMFAFKMYGDSKNACGISSIKF